LHAPDRDDEAIQWIEQSLELSDDRAIAYCDLGATLAWLNRPDEAVAQY
jgi:hypothetical protein